MPSSMIFAGLVVLWLLILVPAVARHRQEVARPTVAALSGRVLERPRRRRPPGVGRELEGDVMNEVDQPRSVATRAGPRVPAARTEVRWHDDDPGPADNGNRVADEHDSHPADDEWDADPDDDPGRDDRSWERPPPPRYRPGRGGFDPEAARLTARARYAFRQRVVLTMLIVAVVTGLFAAVAVPGLWWPHVTVDLVLIGYLVYLRRQVRLEESIRERRAARMAGARHLPAVADPELDEWARQGREVSGGRSSGGRTGGEPELDPEPDRDDAHADDLAREHPERVRGTGDALWAAPASAEPLPDPVEGEPALPRLLPVPPPPLPAGTTLVETDEDDPELYDLARPARPDYRRAVGE